MKKLKLFFACLLMAVLSIGQVWADTATETIAMKGFAGLSSNGYQNVTVSGKSAESEIGMVAYAFNPSTGQVRGGKTSIAGASVTSADNNKNWSLYNSAAMPGAITAIKVTQTATSSNKFQNNLYVSLGTSTQGAVTTITDAQAQDAGGTATEINFTIDGTKNYTFFKLLSSEKFTSGTVADVIVKVTYTTSGGGSTPSLSADPDALDFDVVGKDDVVAAKTFTLTGSNLTDANAVTLTAPTGYTVSPNSVTPSDGAISETITVTPVTGTVGTFNGNLTISSDDLSDDVEVALSMEVKAKYTVTWNNNGATSTTQVLDGEKPVFPATPAACDATSTTFIGWATAPWTGKLADLSEKTVYTSASAMPDVDAAVTYYAVFAKSSGSASELFSWAGGGKEALLAIEGIVSSSLDADYAASHSPYQVKWNGDGKYLIIPVSAQPGKLSVGFKMIGGATTSTVDVQESTATDGEFTNVETLTISGASNDIVSLETTNAFKSTTRAIKLLYHKGSNVGLGPISIESAVSMSDYMTTCCTKYNVNIAAGIENGSVSADPASACEGATITLTFTPALNYHLSAWTLNGAAKDIAENTFEMPGVDVTVSATFDQDACEPLGTPSVTVSGKAYPYDAVQLAWTAIEHADAYKVYIYDNEDNELEHNDAFAGVEYTIGQTLSASTTYKYSVQAISNTPATYCPSVAAAGTFETDALPTAHLTLIALGEEHASSGDYAILTPFNLPATAATCSKAFVGWDANPDCATAPTYAKGAEFQFNDENDVTLYAVYADETPGAVTLTKLGSGATFADGDKLVIAAKGTNFGLYFENAGSAYVKNWEFEGEDPVLSELTDSKKILTLVKSGDNWKFGDATNGYFYSSSSNNLEISTTNSSEFNSFSWNTTESAFTITKTDGRYLNCRTDLTSTNANLWRFNGTNTNAGSPFLNVYKYAAGASTFDNYSTTCVAAPTAEPASASIAVAAAGGEGTLGVSYENVNLAGVTVALYNNEACTVAFDGGWLTASIAGDDKHIAYNAQANTSYNDARTAYIKLTAPETNGAANPAVVVIPVEQAKKPAVFDNLADLVAANIATGTQVTVSFEEVITNDQTISGPKRAGLYLTTTAGSSSKAIEIFYNKGTTAVPAEWVIGGKLAATSMTFTWTLFNSDQWELVPLGNDWTWDNGDLTYTAPKAVSSVVVSGSPAKTSYVDGEKFAPAGLTVTVYYTEGDPEVNPVGVTFTCDPVRVAKSDDPVSVNVIATFNEVDSDPFEVTGLTVGDIQPKTIAQFIADEGGRCYLEGIVGTIDNTTYGNFYLTDDASGTIYVYGCLTPSGESKKFAELGVEEGDQIKVIAEAYTKHATKGDEAVDVQFVSKVSAATIDIDDINMTVDDELLLSDIVATITPDAAQSATINYEVTEGTAVTISEGKIIASTEGEATITASIAAGTGYLAGSTTFTVSVAAAPTPVPENTDIITAEKIGVTGTAYVSWEDKTGFGTTSFYAGNTTNGTSTNAGALQLRYNATDASKRGGIVLTTSNGLVLKGLSVTAKSGNGTLNVYAKSTAYTGYADVLSDDENVCGKLIGTISGTGNLQLETGISYDDNYQYIGMRSASGTLYLTDITITWGAATEFETVRTPLEVGRYYTVCLPKKVIAIKGASFWTLKNKSQDGATAYLEEETNNLPFAAGKPFIIQATADKLEVVYEGEATETPGVNGAIHGTLTYMDAAALAAAGSNVYMLYNNELRPVGENNHLDANRAYVKVDELNPVSSVPQGAPGKRVVAMPMQKDQAQGFENLDASEKPLKVMIEGQLYILRGEKVYDATGRLVK